MINKSESLNELFSALAKAQGEMDTAGLTSANPFFKSRYADLAEIIKASRPALVKNGLCITQVVTETSEGQQVLDTMLGHVSGQWISGRAKINPAKPDIQSLGSYISYLRRYNYASIVGVIVCDEDDDAESTVERRPTPVTKPIIHKINDTQLAELNNALRDHIDIAIRFKKSVNIDNLADLPESLYRKSMDQIAKIIMAKNSVS